VVRSSMRPACVRKQPIESLRRTCLALLLLTVAAGCRAGATEESFNPTGDTAKDALTAALNAWKGGQAKPGLIESVKPPVQVADATWETGARLTSFEIVKSLEGEERRRFSVKLVLEGETAPQEVVYVVVGKDPMWVMRENEFMRDSGM
jgi:hypothetical protein